MRLKYYLKELQRRHVVKAGIAYLVGAWLIIQVITVVLPLFGISVEVPRTVVIILAIGFPIWLIIAWVFDFSSEGIKKTEDVPYDPEIYRKKNIGLNRFIIGGLLIAVLLLAVSTFYFSEKASSLEEDYLAVNFKSSLAILPFKDLSPEKDADFFSEGVSRGIHDQLARFKNLKLIPTTSSFIFKDSLVGLKVIAEELDARYIIEGSAQLIDDRYRASINLVDTDNNTTVWSKTFDDKLEDILLAYDEISSQVGDLLDVTLNAPEVRSGKIDPEAYLLFLRCRDTLKYLDLDRAILAADSLIRRSIKIDPNYAQSYNLLSQATFHLGVYRDVIPRKEAIKIGKQAAMDALSLDPYSVPGYNWLSNWEWHDRETEASFKSLDSALKYGSSRAELNQYWAHHLMRINQPKKALEVIKKGILLDPKPADFYLLKTDAESILGEYEEALKSIRKFAELTAQNFGLSSWEANLHRLNGNYTDALKVLEEETDSLEYISSKERILYDMNKLQESNELLNQIINFPKDSINTYQNKAFILSRSYANRGENGKAFQELNKGFKFICDYIEWFFAVPEFKKLYDDPRWNQYIDQLREEFNYEFPYQPE